MIGAWKRQWETAVGYQGSSIHHSVQPGSLLKQLLQKHKQSLSYGNAKTNITDPQKMKEPRRSSFTKSVVCFMAAPITHLQRLWRSAPSSIPRAGHIPLGAAHHPRAAGTPWAWGRLGSHCPCPALAHKECHRGAAAGQEPPVNPSGGSLPREEGKDHEPSAQYSHGPQNCAG